MFIIFGIGFFRESVDRLDYVIRLAVTLFLPGFLVHFSVIDLTREPVFVYHPRHNLSSSCVLNMHRGYTSRFKRLLMLEIIFLYLGENIVSKENKQNEAGNRRSKISSLPGGMILVHYSFSLLKSFNFQFLFVESPDEFVQRGIVSITHDMRDQRFLGSAVLDQLKKMEMKFMRHQDHDDDEEFLQNLPLKTMDEFNFFDEEINNKSIRKMLVRNNFATNIILIVFLIFFIISFFSIII